jgi:hypothetical protein
MNPGIYYMSGLSSNELLHAYSLRRVVSGYTGPGIQVRRGTSTTLLQDFYFDPTTGELDQAAILSFVGASTGYVSKWYDQSGNGNTLGVFGTVAGREPIIVTGSAVVTRNGRLAMSLGVNFANLKTVQTGIIPANNLSVFAVISSINTTASGSAVALKRNNDTLGTFVLPRSEGGGDFFNYNGANWIVLGTTSTALKVYSGLSDPASISAWKNNVFIGTVNQTNTNIGQGISLGYQTINNSTFNNFSGTHQEILFYTGNPSNRSSITSEIMSYYSIV